MMQYKWLWFLFSHGSIAWPNLIATRDDSKFEWTALGDSYASGVGSTGYVDGRRCLRYDKAYPVLLNGDSSLGEGEHIFNNVACSGAHSGDVELYQFYNEDTTNQPTWSYSPRPKFGNPQMATLAVGGDDIDFPGILFNCILESHIIGGPPQRTCDDQRRHTWNLINSPDLIDKIDSVIKKTVTEGRKGPIGNDFKLYVTGYGEFFNESDPDCDKVTFARTANPNPDGKDHIKMTTEIRSDFNDMSKALNAAIQDAVSRNQEKGVKFIDIQGNGALDGHRFCESGIKEPDQHNAKLWFWHYPYNEPKDKNTDILQKASDKVANGLSMEQLSSKYPDTTDYTNALFDAIDFQEAQRVDGGDDVDPKGLWDSIGYRAKVFHPQVPFHTHIKDLILAQYKEDLQAQTATKPDDNHCHGIGGDIWVMHRDTAAQNVKDFCSQSSKSVEYNEGTVDHLRLSVECSTDDSKGPDSAPDCKNKFINGVIDGCDGSDPVNNPHDYKFGSTLTLGNKEWVYKMEPLSVQVNDDNCDVSYKFFYDGFEVRGKNWPDAKLGTNGEGLLKELRGCGVVSKWKFEYTPNDVKYQWYAHGSLPIGTKNCVGNAVVTAGGSTKGNCHGAGK